LSAAGSALRGRRVLVLGAAGFIGRWVTAALEKVGAHVTASVRDPRSAPEAFEMAGVRCKPLLLDVTDFEALGRLLRDENPEITFNLAGYGVDRAERDPDLARRINEELPKRVAEILLERSGAEDRAFVHTGSALEYGVADRVGEDDPTDPTTDYGRTKLAGTDAVRAAADQGLRAFSARLFTVYGPGEHPGRLLPSLLEVAASGGVVELSEGLQKRDFTYVGDAVEGLLRLACVPHPPAIVNLATGRLESVRDFVSLAARELRMGEDRLRFGARAGRDEMAHAPVPVGLLRTHTKWTPEVSIPEGVRRTLAILRTGEEVA